MRILRSINKEEEGCKLNVFSNSSGKDDLPREAENVDSPQLEIIHVLGTLPLFALKE